MATSVVRKSWKARMDPGSNPREDRINTFRLIVTNSWKAVLYKKYIYIYIYVYIRTTSLLSVRPMAIIAMAVEC